MSTDQDKKALNVVEIAKLSGSSKSAVSRVIQNQPGVAPEVRARIQHVIRAHHYQPSILGRALRGASTGMIGVLGRWMGSGFTAEVIRGIDDEVKKQGCHTMCMLAPGIEEYIRFWRILVTGRQVDGVILLAPPLDLYKHRVEPSDKPVVLCAAEPPRGAVSWRGAGSVTLDNTTAMKQLVEHVTKQGCRRLRYLAGQPDTFDSQERSRVFLKSAKLQGVNAAVIQGAWIKELGYSVVRKYLMRQKRKPDAILCFNDYIAMGCLQALEESKIDVPGQIAVTGWDDVPGADYLGLTTVRLPMLEMGWEASRMLFQLMSSAKTGATPRTRVKLKMPLQVRITTARRST